MEQKQFIIQMLPIVMQSDPRLAYCTFREVDKVLTHSIKTCPRCQAMWILAGCPQVDT